MPEQNLQNVISLLTICRKAGRLLLGFDAAAEAMKAKQAELILITTDISPKTEKEVRFYAGKNGAVTVCRLPFEMNALTVYFRKKTGVFTVTDGGFAAKLQTLLNAETETETDT